MIHKHFNLCFSCPCLFFLQFFYLLQISKFIIQIFKRVQTAVLFLYFKIGVVLWNFKLRRVRFFKLIVCNARDELGCCEIESADLFFVWLNYQLVILLIIHWILLIHFLHHLKLVLLNKLKLVLVCGVVDQGFAFE